LEINQTFRGWRVLPLTLTGENTMHDSEPVRKEGPHSTEQSDKPDDLGFDPDSPDVDDPQVDPQGPAKAPGDIEKDK
jgi:hypothetical protein